MLTSCRKEKWFCIEGNRDVAMKVLNVSSFSKVELEFDAQVYLSQGAQEVKMLSSDSFFGYIEVDIKVDNLVLDVKNGKWRCGNLYY
jgi:hypothetical protein